ncbi:hypothetical protein BESB_078560 [Besnoitia besnoiti]|uniref:Protein kinase domain-containing protein n=1 Tax=Besnoitia besnoiti TaxID=94643 RepID=A0A2A9ME29_BESBE|nr:hypothetical protein BESB_078560 [Besnoitia besnoiti]PFH33640.1 hypothetical protein BESB_078560 [Besnoitia besnoiti]
MSKKKIGGYILDERIGRGSFAAVWKGHIEQTKEAVAVKVISRHTVYEATQLNQEVAILKQLQHPNIVRFIDLKKSQYHYYLVLEFCSGGDVASLLRQHGGRVGEAVARRLLQQMAAGLLEIHRRSYIHRDLKPQNLLLSSVSPHEATLKIADFGFARSLQPWDLAATVCGSPLYMAPEILQHQYYDAKADLWSVGAIFFEILHGRPPFSGQNPLQLLKNIERASQAGPPFSARVPLSPSCRDLLRRLLRANPLERMSPEDFFSHPYVAGEAAPGATPRLPVMTALAAPQTWRGSREGKHEATLRKGETQAGADRAEAPEGREASESGEPKPSSDEERRRRRFPNQSHTRQNASARIRDEGQACRRDSAASEQAPETAAAGGSEARNPVDAGRGKGVESRDKEDEAVAALQTERKGREDELEPQTIENAKADSRAEARAPPDCEAPLSSDRPQPSEGAESPRDVPPCREHKRRAPLFQILHVQSLPQEALPQGFAHQRLSAASAASCSGAAALSSSASSSSSRALFQTVAAECEPAVEGRYSVPAFSDSRPAQGAEETLVANGRQRRRSQGPTTRAGLRLSSPESVPGANVDPPPTAEAPVGKSEPSVEALGEEARSGAFWGEADPFEGLRVKAHERRELRGERGCEESTSSPSVTRLCWQDAGSFLSAPEGALDGAQRAAREAEPSIFVASTSSLADASGHSAAQSAPLSARAADGGGRARATGAQNVEGKERRDLEAPLQARRRAEAGHQALRYSREKNERVQLARGEARYAAAARDVISQGRHAQRRVGEFWSARLPACSAEESARAGLQSAPLPHLPGAAEPSRASFFRPYEETEDSLLPSVSPRFPASSSGVGLPFLWHVFASSSCASSSAASSASRSSSSYTARQGCASQAACAAGCLPPVPEPASAAGGSARLKKGPSTWAPVSSFAVAEALGGGARDAGRRAPAGDAGACEAQAPAAGHHAESDEDDDTGDYVLVLAEEVPRSLPISRSLTSPADPQAYRAAMASPLKGSVACLLHGSCLSAADATPSRSFVTKARPPPGAENVERRFSAGLASFADSVRRSWTAYRGSEISEPPPRLPSVSRPSEPRTSPSGGAAELPRAWEGGRGCGGRVERDAQTGRREEEVGAISSVHAPLGSARAFAHPHVGSSAAASASYSGAVPAFSSPPVSYSDASASPRPAPALGGGAGEGTGPRRAEGDRARSAYPSASRRRGLCDARACVEAKGAPREMGHAAAPASAHGEAAEVARGPADARRDGQEQRGRLDAACDAHASQEAETRGGCARLEACSLEAEVVACGGRGACDSETERKRRGELTLLRERATPPSAARGDARRGDSGEGGGDDTGRTADESELRRAVGRQTPRSDEAVADPTGGETASGRGGASRGRCVFASLRELDRDAPSETEDVQRGSPRQARTGPTSAAGEESPLTGQRGPPAVLPPSHPVSWSAAPSPQPLSSKSSPARPSPAPAMPASAAPPLFFSSAFAAASSAALARAAAAPSSAAPVGAPRPPAAPGTSGCSALGGGAGGRGSARGEWAALQEASLLSTHVGNLLAVAADVFFLAQGLAQAAALQRCREARRRLDDRRARAPANAAKAELRRLDARAEGADAADAQAPLDLSDAEGERDARRPPAGEVTTDIPRDAEELGKQAHHCEARSGEDDTEESSRGEARSGSEKRRKGREASSEGASAAADNPEDEANAGEKASSQSNATNVMAAWGVRDSVLLCDCHGKPATRQTNAAASKEEWLQVDSRQELRVSSKGETGKLGHAIRHEEREKDEEEGKEEEDEGEEEEGGEVEATAARLACGALGLVVPALRLLEKALAVNTDRRMRSTLLQVFRDTLALGRWSLCAARSAGGQGSVCASPPSEISSPAWAVEEPRGGGGPRERTGSVSRAAACELCAASAGASHEPAASPLSFPPPATFSRSPSGALLSAQSGLPLVPVPVFSVMRPGLQGGYRLAPALASLSPSSPFSGGASPVSSRRLSRGQPPSVSPAFSPLPPPTLRSPQVLPASLVAGDGLGVSGSPPGPLGAVVTPLFLPASLTPPQSPPWPLPLSFVLPRRVSCLATPGAHAKSTSARRVSFSSLGFSLAGGAKSLSPQARTSVGSESLLAASLESAASDSGEATAAADDAEEKHGVGDAAGFSGARDADSEPVEAAAMGETGEEGRQAERTKAKKAAGKADAEGGEGGDAERTEGPRARVRGDEACGRGLSTGRQGAPRAGGEAAKAQAAEGERRACTDYEGGRTGQGSSDAQEEDERNQDLRGHEEEREVVPLGEHRDKGCQCTFCWSSLPAASLDASPTFLLPSFANCLTSHTYPSSDSAAEAAFASFHSSPASASGGESPLLSSFLPFSPKALSPRLPALHAASLAVARVKQLLAVNAEQLTFALFSLGKKNFSEEALSSSGAYGSSRAPHPVSRTTPVAASTSGPSPRLLSSPDEAFSGPWLLCSGLHFRERIAELLLELLLLLSTGAGGEERLQVYQQLRLLSRAIAIQKLLHARLRLKLERLGEASPACAGGATG